MRSPIFFFALVVSSALVGCSGAAVRPSASPDELRADACSLGQSTKEVRGSIWMNAKSSESSGQFPAEVVATQENLRLEVTNLVGGREALITVEGTKYTIEREGRTQKGRKSWGGIPLEWAHALFLGRVPCPSDAASIKAQRVTDEGDLVIETVNNDRFTYRYHSWSGKPWPESVRWESGRSSSKPLQVEFEFQEPDDKTGSAKIWIAKSERGEVKVRWKDRETR